MAWLGATVLLLIVLAASWHIHPEAPGLVIVLVVLGPLFLSGLGMMLGDNSKPAERVFGMLLAGATGMGLLWGVSLVM